MANVIHRTTLRFMPSVNEPDYPEPAYKWNPDMSQVAAVPPKYWKWDAVGERPVEMTAPEKATVDAAIAAAEAQAVADQRTALGLTAVATMPAGTGTGTVCAGDDPRLADARPPTAHTHPVTDIIGLPAGGGPATVKKTADQTFNATGPADVTGLSFAVLAGVYYYFRFICLVRSDTATVGVRLTVTHPGATRFGGRAFHPVAADGAGCEFQGAITSSGDAVIPTAVPAVNTDYVAVVEGVILPSAPGTLQLRAGTETGTTVVTVRQGSVGMLFTMA